jgi:hypothetical protein
MSSKLKPNQIRFEHHTYQYEEWERPRGESGPPTRYWERLGSRPRKLDHNKYEKLRRKLDKLVEEDNRESFGGYTSRELREEKAKKKQNRKDRTETHQDAHGILWLPDYKPTTRRRAFYWGLRMHRKLKHDGIVQVEVCTSKGRATHLHDKKAMTAMLQKVVSTFERAYGKKALQKAITPLVEVQI